MRPKARPCIFKVNIWRGNNSSNFKTDFSASSSTRFLEITLEKAELSHLRLICPSV